MISDQEAFISYRKYLHQHPELSGQEVKTSSWLRNLIADFWSELSFEGIDNKSFIAHYKARDSNALHLGFRCELDALPIVESNNFEHKSKIDKVSHKCGHDGHMATLLRLIHKAKTLQPSVHLSFIFQSAEETGQGAAEIVTKSKLLAEKPLDSVFALHNVPGFKLGEVLLKEGAFTPSVISLKISLTGKTSHAAETEKGINPMFVMAQLLDDIKSLEVPDRFSKNMVLVAPIFMQSGTEAYGTSPGDGEMGFTIRCWSEERLSAIRNQIENLIQLIPDEVNCQLEWVQHFPNVENSKEEVRIAKISANQIGLETTTKKNPFEWGEDFGAFTKKYSGMMYGLGAGENHPALHHPDYDFPDELIEIGSDLFLQIIKHYND